MDIGQRNQKFVAPWRLMVSVSRTHWRKALRDLLQQLVSNRMAQRVVDGLEMVQVHVKRPSVQPLRSDHAVARKTGRGTARGWAGRSTDRGAPENQCAPRFPFALGDVLNEGQHQRLVVDIDQLGRQAHLAYLARLAAPLRFKSSAVPARLSSSSQAWREARSTHKPISRVDLPMRSARVQPKYFHISIDLNAKRPSDAWAIDAASGLARKSHLKPLLGLAQHGDVLHGARQSIGCPCASHSTWLVASPTRTLPSVRTN